MARSPPEWCAGARARSQFHPRSVGKALIVSEQNRIVGGGHEGGGHEGSRHWAEEEISEEISQWSSWQPPVT